MFSFHILNKQSFQYVYKVDLDFNKILLCLNARIENCSLLELNPSELEKYIFFKTYFKNVANIQSEQFLLYMIFSKYSIIGNDFWFLEPYVNIENFETEDIFDEINDYFYLNQNKEEFDFNNLFNLTNIMYEHIVISNTSINKFLKSLNSPFLLLTYRNRKVVVEEIEKYINDSNIIVLRRKI